MWIRQLGYAAAATALFISYLIFDDDQRALGTPVREDQSVEEVVRALKSDALALKHDVDARLFGPKIVRLLKYALAVDDHSFDLSASKQDHISYLADYVYSEVPPDKKPAEIALDSLKDVPVGTPVEEIRRAAAVFGLDFNFMKVVAKIESDFDPKQRTGSYVGLFQLSNHEFARYGSGDILNARDNAIAAAYKFATAAIMFELSTHKKATLADLYLIHQQGTQGAEQHVKHPDDLAWKSMCATDEGKQKGERWCKRAVWGNTLPAIKQAWKSVDNLTSGAFVRMWQDQINRFYARYSEARTN
jgi:hypothetical protein